MNVSEMDAVLEEIILRLVAEGGQNGTIKPAEAAVAVGGRNGDAWGALMPAVRRIAIRLANEGRIGIYRKGKPADPNSFKGLYQLGPPHPDG